MKKRANKAVSLPNLHGQRRALIGYLIHATACADVIVGNEPSLTGQRLPLMTTEEDLDQHEWDDHHDTPSRYRPRILWRPFISSLTNAAIYAART